MTGLSSTIRPELYDQVLFAGQGSMEVRGLSDIIPVLDGSKADVSFFEAKGWRGILGWKYGWARNIDVKRICDLPVMIKGRRTLAIWGDLHSMDINKSIIDLALMDCHNKIDKLRVEIYALGQENVMYKQFIKENNLEDNFKERIENWVEFMRVQNQKLAVKQPDATDTGKTVSTDESTKK